MCSSVVSVAKGEGFARPIAVSIIAGKPVFLINDPVFKEFYDGCASFHNEINDLVSELVNKVYILDEVRNTTHRERFLVKTHELRKSFDEARTIIFEI